jgi:hypothetical protein
LSVSFLLIFVTSSAPRTIQHRDCCIQGSRGWSAALQQATHVLLLLLVLLMVLFLLLLLLLLLLVLLLLLLLPVLVL